MAKPDYKELYEDSERARHKSGIERDQLRNQNDDLRKDIKALQIRMDTSSKPMSDFDLSILVRIVHSESNSETLEGGGPMFGPIIMRSYGRKSPHSDEFMVRARKALEMELERRGIVPPLPVPVRDPVPERS